MTQRRIEQGSDVFVMKRIDALTPDPLYTHQVLVPQHPELVGHGRLLHAEVVYELAHGVGALSE